MSHGGYIKLYRSLANDSLWTAQKFTKGQAWCDLLMLANHKPKSICVRGVRVPIRRGQVGWSIKKLADRWGWSRGAADRYLNGLQTAHQIEQQKTVVSTIITITNYERYQGNGNQTDTQTKSKTGSKARREQEGRIKKEEVGTEEIDPYHGLLPSVLDTPAFREALGLWLAYQAESNFEYKPVGMKTLIREAEDRASDHGVQAVCDAMKAAISNTHKGWNFESKFRNEPPANGAPVLQRMPTPEEDQEWRP